MPQINIGPVSVDLRSGWTLSTIIFAGPQDDQQPDPSLLTPNVVRPFQRNLVVTCEAVSASVTADSYVKSQSDGLRKAGVAHGYARPPERVDLSGDREGVITEAVVVGPNGERVVRITAKRFTYEPSEVTLVRGQPVILELVSLDRTHGFRQPQLNIRTEIPEGSSTRVRIVPDQAGRFFFACDVFCGSGHEEMEGDIVVTDQ